MGTLNYYSRILIFSLILTCKHLLNTFFYYVTHKLDLLAEVMFIHNLFPRIIIADVNELDPLKRGSNSSIVLLKII